MAEVSRRQVKAKASAAEIDAKMKAFDDAWFDAPAISC